METAIIIPAYQASGTLPKVIASLPEELAEGGGRAIIVNDGSPDDTGEVADRLAEEHGHVVAVHNAESLGYGGAIKKGLAHGYDLGCDIFAVVHSNGQSCFQYGFGVHQRVDDFARNASTLAIISYPN